VWIILTNNVDYLCIVPGNDGTDGITNTPRPHLKFSKFLFMLINKLNISL
jgi:hypothetical protein